MRGYDPNNWEAWLNGIELTIRTKALEYNTVSFVIAAGNDGKDILKSINTPALINDIENVYVVGSKDEYSSRGNHLYYQDSTYKEHEGTSISAARYARVLYERHE